MAGRYDARPVARGDPLNNQCPQCAHGPAADGRATSARPLKGLPLYLPHPYHQHTCTHPQARTAPLPPRPRPRGPTRLLSRTTVAELLLVSPCCATSYTLRDTCRGPEPCLDSRPSRLPMLGAGRGRVLRCSDHPVNHPGTGSADSAVILLVKQLLRYEVRMFVAEVIKIKCMTWITLVKPPQQAGISAG